MFAIGAFTFPLLLTTLTKNNPDNLICTCYFMLIVGILSWIMYFIIPTSESFTTERKEKTLPVLHFLKSLCFIFVLWQCSAGKLYLKIKKEKFIGLKKYHLAEYTKHPLNGIFISNYFTSTNSMVKFSSFPAIS